MHQHLSCVEAVAEQDRVLASADRQKEMSRAQTTELDEGVKEYAEHDDHLIEVNRV